MLSLDDEDYETLGYGSTADSIDYARYISVLLSRRQEQSSAAEARRPKRVRRGRPGQKLETLKAWRKKNPEKWRAINKKYMQTAKGKAMKSKSNRAYYLKNREREIARVNAARAKKRAEREQA